MTDASKQDMDLSTRQGLETNLLARRQARKRAPQIKILPREQLLPLSTAQKSLWFAHLVSREPSLNNVIQAERLRGLVDEACLRNAFDDLVERQEVLRLQIETVEGIPFLRPCETRPRLQVHDLTGLSASDREQKIQRVVDKEANVPFQLQKEPPVRGALYKFADDDFLLIVVVHHISCDEWSSRTLRSDLVAFYNARKTGAVADLPDLHAQYADLAAQSAALEADDAQRAALDRWVRRLKGARRDDRLPASSSACSEAGEDGMVSFLLPEDLTARIDTLGREAQATPFMTMLAITLCFLHQQTGRHDITIATQVAGRVNPDAAYLVGLFTNTVPVRSKVTETVDFHQVLHSVRRQILDALNNQSVRYETMIQRLGVKRSHDMASYAHTMFLHRKSFDAMKLAKGVKSQPVTATSRGVKHDVWVSVIDGAEGRLLRLAYDGRRHDAAQMQSMLEAFVALAHQVTTATIIELCDETDAPGAERGADSVASEAGRTTFSAVDPELLATVSELWSTVLGGRVSDIDASFFDEGGDSLLLMQLAHRIETAFGVPVPLPDMFESPTIRSFTGRIHERCGPSEPAKRWDKLIEPLLTSAQRSGSEMRPKYFLVAGGGGHVAPFSSIARRIDARWEGLGVLDPALFADEPEQRSIESLASRMATAIRSVDSDGPWLLAGYSAGGRTVYEIARQLREQGGNAGCVILDAGVSPRTMSSETIRFLRWVKRLGRVSYRRVSDLIMAWRIGDEMAVEMQRRKYRRISDLQHGRLLKYHTPPTDTLIALVRATEGRRFRNRKDRGWAGLARLLTIIDTPGDHWTCLKGENEAHFADAFDRALAVVRKAISAGSVPSGEVSR